MAGHSWGNEGMPQATLDRFHAVRREGGHLVTCVDFRSDDHLYDVDFVLTTGPDFTIREATLHRIDEEEVSSATAVASTR